MVAKIKCLLTWPERVLRMKERYEINECELSKLTCKAEYEEKLK